MMEFYVLIAIVSNVIADIFVWHEVMIMRKSHLSIEFETKKLYSSVFTLHETIHDEIDNHGQKLAEALGMVVNYFSEGLEPALETHAERVVKGLRGVIGYYQGKAEKSGQEEMEGINDTLKALGPLAALVQDVKPSSSSPKFHT